MSDFEEAVGRIQGLPDRPATMERRRVNRQALQSLPLNGSAQVSVNSSAIAGAWKAAVDLSGGDCCVAILSVAHPHARGTIFSSGCNQSDLIFLNADELRRYFEAADQSPRDVLVAFGVASGEVLQELLEQGDDITRQIASSYLRFRQDSMRYTRIAETAFTTARSYKFDFPKG